MKSKIQHILSLADEFLCDSNIQASVVQQLSLIEKKLLSCVASGQVLIHDGKSHGLGEETEDISNPAPDENKVRGQLIHWLCSNQQAKGLVDPFGIQIEGVEITGVETESKQGSFFLSLASLAIPFPLVFRRCSFPNHLYLLGAEIPFLDLEGSSVGFVEADMLRIRGDLYFRHGFRAGGCIRMLGASIGGDFDCTGASFNCQTAGESEDFQYALRAEGIKVAGDVLLRRWEPKTSKAPIEFVANGVVSLQGAKIDGDLRCDGGVFHGPQKPDGTTGPVAIEASRIEVGGSVFLQEGFQAHAEVALTSARIGGNFEGRNGMFVCKSFDEDKPGVRDALCIDGIKVGRDVNLERSCVKGRLRFSGGEAGGDFDCEHCEPQGEVVAQRTTVKGIWFWREVNTGKLLKIDFRDSTVGGIVDEEKSWPRNATLTLDGFQYSRFSKGPKSAELRLKWLGLQERFALQPYKQLAKVMRDDGDVSGSRKVLYEMECLRRKFEMSAREGRNVKTLAVKTWHWIQRKTIGFGYYPQRALLCLAGLTLIGWALYWQAFNDKVIAPTDASAYQSFRKDGYAPAHYQRFHAFAYSLANCFPVLNMGKADFWQPDPNPEMSVQPSAPFYFLRKRLAYPGLLTVFRYVQVFLGWVLTTLGVAAITGVTHKD